MKISNEHDLSKKDISAFCDNCKSYTTHKVLEQKPVDIPPGELYEKLQCKDCGDIQEATSISLTFLSDEKNERG
jgi:uncharacterized Zn finger protein